jgi:PEP-CTERM motif
MGVKSSHFRFWTVLLISWCFITGHALADPINWSWKSIKVGTVDVFGKYPDEQFELKWYTGGYGGGDERISGMVGAMPGGKQPDKRVVFSTSDNDPVLLEAAIAGSPGNFRQVELAQALLSLIGTREYETPMLAAPTGELYTGVDLFQWLLNPPPFQQGDGFDFVNGVNAELPGIIVGTSPIVFSSATGLTTTDPYTGEVRVIGISDGSVIPEPGTAMLFGLGLLGVAGLLCKTTHSKRRNTGDAQPGS